LNKPLIWGYDNWEREIEFGEVAGRITGGDRTVDSDGYTKDNGKRKSNH
jgi:hypothetical protein